MSMMMHCGAGSASLDALRAVPVPSSPTWKPIPYGDIIDRIKARSEVLMPEMSLHSEGYALTPNGARCFGQMAWSIPDSEKHGPSIAFRQSYNKTLAVAWAGGSHTFVCDNLTLTGSSFRLVRKNTTHAWDSFCEMLDSSLVDLRQTFTGLLSDYDVMAEIPVTTSRGFEILGRAHGEGRLTARAIGKACDEWKKPTHEDFAGRDLYCLYQACTDALKTSGTVDRLTRQTRLHDFFYKVALATLPMETPHAEI